MAIRVHYDALCGFISNLAIMADSDKQSRDQSLYAMNTNRLFIFTTDLIEKAYDAKMIFETREAIEMYNAALTISREILAMIQLTDTLSQQSASSQEERKQG